jgi:hypothetical protein
MTTPDHNTVHGLLDGIGALLDRLTPHLVGMETAGSLHRVCRTAIKDIRTAYSLHHAPKPVPPPVPFELGGEGG